jgi:hypothetical protein
LIGGAIAGTILALKNHHGSGLPPGFKCPFAHFEHEGKCIECPNGTIWNGSNCTTINKSVVEPLIAAPIPINPYIDDPIITKDAD